MNRNLHSAVPVVSFLLLLAVTAPADAQFKELGPPPFPPAIARQKIKTLLEKVDQDNRAQTVTTISGWLPWYRDIVDEELISAWQKDNRANLPGVIKPLASARLASTIVEFSWNQQREATFNLTYAPLLGELMARYADSAKPFLNDLRGRMPELSQSEAEGVCRILLDMPDIGTWRKDAMRVLPRYRAVTETLLAQDLRSGDQERGYRAEMWRTELGFKSPSAAPDRPTFATDRSPGAPDRQTPRRSVPTFSTSPERMPNPDRPVPDPAQPTAANRPTLSTRPVSPPPSAVPIPSAPSAPRPYDGAASGTLECVGRPVPQNAEYVFRNLPLVKMQLEYDTKIWDARLVPGEGQTQRLILRNKLSGPQKRCVVHWSVIP